MKTFTKVCLITAGVSLALGIALTATGFALNGGNGFYMKWDHGFKFSDSIEAFEKGRTEIGSFKDVEIDVSSANVNFIESDSGKFEIEYRVESDEEADIVCEVKDNKLTFKDRSDSAFIISNFNFLYINDKDDLYVNVYYPAGTEFGNVHLDTSAGDVKISDTFNCELLDLDMSAGKTNLSNVSGALKVDMSAGSFTATDCNFGFGEFDMSAGSIKMVNCTLDGGDVDMSAGDFDAEELVLTKSIKLDMSAGSVDIKFTDGQEIGYDFDLSAGSAKINGEKKGDEYEDKKGYDIIVTVDASAGSVNITNN
ncbi:MAG: DUF4097 family beta strand repeat protein [Clostridiales bacterium]|nr:DUF4097 family beta strand repeat protein [Clostridiales bacterium]